MNIDPVVAAAGQLLMSSVIMILLVFAFDSPAALIESSTKVWIAVIVMAIFSTLCRICT